MYFACPYGGFSAPGATACSNCSMAAWRAFGTCANVTAVAPTVQLTKAPSIVPTSVPTLYPTSVPTVNPTTVPTIDIKFFGFTNAAQNFTVPPGINQLWMILAGAAGGAANNTGSSGAGGKGGCISSTIPVTPGQVLYIFVGGQGAMKRRGYNGGGLPQGFGGGGGGASDVRTSLKDLSSRLIVAGGGGGGVWWGPGGAGEQICSVQIVYFS